MNPQHIALRRAIRARQSQQSILNDLCSHVSLISLGSRRPIHTSRTLHASASPDSNAKAGSRTKSDTSSTKTVGIQERMKMAQKRAREKMAVERQEYENSVTTGGISENSAFGGDLKRPASDEPQQQFGLAAKNAFDNRNPAHMEQVLNPRPNARLRWQRKMVIREVQRRGRLSKEMRIARTERTHAAKSHFFKTSMKKLAPLARQIAGKSIDEAILQMRFSKKKVAQDVRQHLIQARNESIVMKGMGLGRVNEGQEGITLQSDPSEMPALPHQTPLKTLKKGLTPHETDVYIAEAWTNRGPYGSEPDFRARGRMYIKKPPHTGLTVLLKEEKTRTREKAEKEARALRKRLGKNMWMQLPDRKVTAQRQHVLW